MSWSVNIIGTKEKLTSSIPTLFDTQAANYTGTPEGDEILAIKAIVMKALENWKDNPYVQPGLTSGVKLEASGSHGGSTSSWLTLSVSMQQVALDI